MSITKFKGVSMVLADGVSYVVPALSLRSVQALQDRLASYTGGADPASVELVLDTVHAALSRNYADISRDLVADSVDMRNMRDMMDAVMGVSGLVEKTESGEAVAAVGSGQS